MSRVTPEGKVKACIDDALRVHHAFIVNPATWGMGESGVGDKIVCVYGHFVGIEAKAGKNKPTELQRGKLREVYAAGGTACVINESNIKELTALLMRLQADRKAGRRTVASIIQPNGVDIFQEIVTLRPEDFV